MERKVDFDAVAFMQEQRNRISRKYTNNLQFEDLEDSGIVVGVRYVEGERGVFLLNELEII